MTTLIKHQQSQENKTLYVYKGIRIAELSYINPDFSYVDFLEPNWTLLDFTDSDLTINILNAMLESMLSEFNLPLHFVHFERRKDIFVRLYKKDTRFDSITLCYLSFGIGLTPQITIQKRRWFFDTEDKTNNFYSISYLKAIIESLIKQYGGSNEYKEL